VVNQVDFSVGPGETLGVIGESGCGKSVTSLSIMRLIPKPWGRIDSGQVMLQGEDLFLRSAADFRKIRGREISMVFQDPMTSLNPVLTIGVQLFEVLDHLGLTGKQKHQRAIELLNEVGISDAPQRLKAYAHELSGGMKQRVMIAMAIAANPKVLIADEPTTALDVTIQAQILRLLKKLQSDYNMSLVLITHDLGVVAQVCDHVLVMYGGHVVEKAAVSDLFRSPLHPYTAGLIRSIKSLTDKTTKKLYTIPGQVPRLGQFGQGCVFYSRCDQRKERCEIEKPPLSNEAGEHQAACFYPVSLGVL